MIQYELFDGKRYLFTVSQSEDLKSVLRQEAKRYGRLRVVTVTNGKRSEPVPVSIDVATEFSEEDFEDDELDN